ncbi:hypothetical protein ACHAXR_007669 [Thalassiosira sp. AJA248-18]
MVNFPNVHMIPHPRELRQKFQPSGETSGALLFGWLLSSFLAIIIPVSKWAAERNRYHKYYGQYNEYEQQQRQYEEQANGNYNNNGSYYNLCSWWDLKCKYRMHRYQQQYGNYNNNGDNGGGSNDQQMRAMLPSWYFFFGGSLEDDEREREEMGMSSNEGSMKFVYVCTIMMFIGLSVFGYRSMYAGKDRMGVIVALLIFGQFSLMNLLTTVQGTVETDNRFFEDSIYGWFGQWSVLVAYTDFWLMLHCFGFAGFLGLLRCLDKKAQQDVSNDVAAEDSEFNMEMGYRQEDQDSVLTERQRYGMS